MADAFKVESRRHDTLWIFSTHGYINNFGGESIASKFDEAFKEGGRSFVFDLTQSNIINSIGISFLIEILETVLESDGKLAFCNCAPIIEKTFKIMGITQYARIYTSLDDALNDMRENK